MTVLESDHTAHRARTVHDIAAHRHPFTNLAVHPCSGPLVIVRGDAICVEGDRGRCCLEAMSGLWCASLGFSSERLAAVGSRALNTLPSHHTFGDRTNPAAIARAEKPLTLAPVPPGSRLHSECSTPCACSVPNPMPGAERAGLKHQDIVSGAGHDAVHVSRVAPTAMIFVPCKDGISHNEIKDAKPEHLAAGCNVLLHAMLARAGVVG